MVVYNSGSGCSMINIIWKSSGSCSNRVVIGMWNGSVSWVLMTNCIPMVLGFFVDDVLSHVVGIWPYALRDQVNESFFSDALGWTMAINLEELVPDWNESVLTHAVTTWWIFVNNSFNFLDDFLDDFNFNNFFIWYCFLDNFFNLFNSVLVDKNLLLNLFNLDSLVVNWNLNSSLDFLNLSVWNMNFSCLNLSMLNWNFCLHSMDVMLKIVIKACEEAGVIVLQHFKKKMKVSLV